jgi:hypothetical protein
MAVDGWELPLRDPLAGRGSGQLIIEQGVVEPGPLGRQLVQLAQLVKQMAEGNPLDVLLKSPDLTNVNPQQTAAWLQLPPQQIAFKLEQQQFIHERMSLTVAGVPMTTRGSIGLDSSINLVAEIPILENWIQRQPALAGLKGTAIRIPITGSLTQPRVDHRALAQFSTQLFQKAAGSQIESKLNSLLNEALQPSAAQSPTGTNGVPAQPASTGTSSSPGESLQKAVENNLRQGLDRLFTPNN